MALRHSFAFNSWVTWRERLVAALLFILGGGCVYLGLTRLEFWQALILWAIFALIVAVCYRQGWVVLFGPVLFYDMIRTARRSRYSIMRMIYGGFLFFMLCYLFLILALNPREFRPRDTAVLAEVFFLVFMIVQITAVVLLTPAYVAGAIAEEKDRKTLEFMLATDLHNREIVLSKLLSRLANLTLLLLTGLPFLAILQLVGGVDAELVLAGFAGTGLTMLGIGSLSVLASTVFKKPRDAISLTYLLMLTYASLTSFALLARGHPVLALPIWFGGQTLGDLVLLLNAGNPITAINDVMTAISGRNRMGAPTNLATELPLILTRYAWFHLALAAVCVAWSIVRLRAIALKQASAGTTARAGWLTRLRPAVGPYPMLWKEFFIDAQTRFNWLVWLAIFVLVALSLGTGLWIIGAFAYGAIEGEAPFAWHGLSTAMNVWFRIAGTCVGCLTLLMLAVRAATSVTSERERDTFDALIATPISADAIMLAKVVGAMTSLRPAWVWFGAMMILAVCTGGLHPLAVPFLVGAWLVYAAFVSMLGVYLSMLSVSSTWAVLATMLLTLFLGGGHWLITSCFCSPAFGLILFAINQQIGPGHEREFLKIAEYFVKFQAGVTPPVVFPWCACSLDEPMNQGRNWWEVVGMSVLGLFLWTGVCAIMWFGLLVPTCRRIARRHELE